MSGIFSESPFYCVDELAEWLYACALPNSKKVGDLAAIMGCNTPELSEGNAVLRLIKDYSEREIWAIQVEVISHEHLHSYFASIVQFMVEKQYPDASFKNKVIQSYKLAWGRQHKPAAGTPTTCSDLNN